MNNLNNNHIDLFGYPLDDINFYNEIIIKNYS